MKRSKQLEYITNFTKNIINNKILSTLTEDEDYLLRLRFGLVDGKARTLSETGKELCVSIDETRKMEAKALRKLKLYGVKYLGNCYIKEIKPYYLMLKPNEKEIFISSFGKLLTTESIRKLGK